VQDTSRNDILLHKIKCIIQWRLPFDTNSSWCCILPSPVNILWRRDLCSWAAIMRKRRSVSCILAGQLYCAKLTIPEGEDRVHVILILLSITNVWELLFVQCKHSCAAREDYFVPFTLNNVQPPAPNKLRKLNSAYHALIVTGAECSFSNNSVLSFHWIRGVNIVCAVFLRHLVASLTYLTLSHISFLWLMSWQICQYVFYDRVIMREER
jgi:hypothetical protein